MVAAVLVFALFASGLVVQRRLQGRPMTHPLLAHRPALYAALVMVCLLVGAILAGEWAVFLVGALMTLGWLVLQRKDR